MAETPAPADLLRRLPAVDKVLRSEALKPLADAHPRDAVADAVRKALGALRDRVLAAPAADHDVSVEAVAHAAGEALTRRARPAYMRVVNGTGVVLHTGLGRSPLCREAVDALGEALKGYSRLAMDLATGRRKNREDDLKGLLGELTGAESATVVNNNAAATMIVLNTLAAGKEVVCARGQLVEIGGAFRMPEVMEMSGAKLREIGTTNKVHLRDYEKAIGPATGAILKVHTSNYRIVGFTSEVPIAELAALGRAKGVPVIDDIGSGAILDFAKYGIDEEPTIQESLRAGADVVCVSADKLLGGSQGGIILGRKAVIEAIRKNPLMRALRIGKMTAIVLEQTLKVLLDAGTRETRHTVLRLISTPAAALEPRARALRERIAAAFGTRVRAEALEDRSEVGGGTTPTKSLPTWAVSLEVPGLDAGELASRLRLQETPVCGRVHKETLLLDVRTFFDGDDDLVLKAIEGVVAGLPA
ncbi:MAG: L-seryl-tRNA(Sec) selenium transferase [Planctomycetes bacterium]|jgi:L-seryl-tRNA(Ser) seleniumtransferase|nr:L-seryl-tRNA(Sec) selenium transferase [Planctomycetota bacterium]